MNQIKDLPPSLFQNLQNLKQLWETHSALQYLWCKLCCVIHLYLCWSTQWFIDWLKASLDESQKHIMDFINNYCTVCVCVCYRNISNIPLAHIYSNQFDTMVNLQSLWVNRS